MIASQVKQPRLTILTHNLIGLREQAADPERFASPDFQRIPENGHRCPQELAIRFTTLTIGREERRRHRD